MTTDKLKVTQSDRGAAAKFYRKFLHRPGEVLVADHMQAGKIDESPLILAFAAHRIASEQPLRERIAELEARDIGWRLDVGEYRDALRAILLRGCEREETQWAGMSDVDIAQEALRADHD